MDEKKLKIELEDLYEENKLKNIFEILKQHINRESDRRDIFIDLKRRYRNLQDDKMRETIPRSEANVEENKIGKSLLDFIRSLEQRDFTFQEVLEEEIKNQIIVFTKKDQVNKLKEFFQQLNYSNLKVKEYSEFEECPDKIDLTVFDNTDLESCAKKFLLEKLDIEEQNKINERIEKMEAILEKKSRYVIHFGEFLFWVSDNRNKAQGANSKFSLHARIKEVIDFVNTYSV